MRSKKKIEIVDRAPQIGARGRGRPRDLAARSAILQASLDLLAEVGFARLTVEEIASRAKVGKPTIYKYWPSKAAVVMDAFFEEIGPGVVFRDHGSALESIHEQMRALAAVFRGRFGVLIRALLGQAQSDPELAQAFRERWTEPRREDGRRVLARAVAQGEIRREIDFEVAIDALWGGLYYRLQVGHAPITNAYIDALFEMVITGLQAAEQPKTKRAR